VLVNFKLKVSGHAGYKLAEVTGGGVPLTEINTATMESKIHSGL
jgi:predicted flavoprotein YhiN